MPKNQPVTREIRASGASAAAVEKGNYRHFMQKEIFEQPTVVAQTLASYLRRSDNSGRAAADGFRPVTGAPPHHRRLRDILFTPGWWRNTGSNNSRASRSISMWRRNSATASRCWRRAVLRCSSRRAGRRPIRSPRSGIARRMGRPSRWSSTFPPAPWRVRPTSCCRPMPGRRSGVASTKAFTCQLAVLAALAAHMAVRKGRLTRDEESAIVRHLLEAPAALNAALDHDDDIAAMAHLIAPARDVLYLGRGQDYPLALEGALKLKEISYIHDPKAMLRAK